MKLKKKLVVLSPGERKYFYKGHRNSQLGSLPIWPGLGRFSQAAKQATSMAFNLGFQTKHILRP